MTLHEAEEPSLGAKLVHIARASVLLVVVLIYYQAFTWGYSLVYDLPAFLGLRKRDARFRTAWNHNIRTRAAGGAKLACVLTGMTIAVEGKVPAGRFLVVSNHQSTADMPLLFYALWPLELKFIAKKELMRWWVPVVPRLLRQGYGIVDFSGRVSTIEGLRAFAKELPEWGGSPLLFPEGIRTVDGEVAPFRGAGLRLLVQETGLPVLPVAIDGLQSARSLGRFFTHLPGSRARVRILEPVPPEEARRDLDGLTVRLEGLIKEAQRRMREGASAV